MRKTKIIATIGPASESREILAELLLSGMNIARLNFSHGEVSDHKRRLENIRLAEKETGLSCKILQDLGGPKIRIGDFKTEEIFLKEGGLFILTSKEVLGDEKRVSVNYPNLSKEVKIGDFIFIKDGRIKLQAVEIQDEDVVCQILVGGELSKNKGVNLPNSDLSIESLTKKDVEDLKFGIENNLDYIALSFVRKPEDILKLRKILDEKKCEALIVAKIETKQAVENIDEIIENSDLIMVARGDLAAETSFEKVPITQKIITEKCNVTGKPTIVATQMMESMIKSSTPTRAEVSDVANAVFDGADIVMLSEETTLGNHPVETVKKMVKVIEEAEKNLGIVD